MASFLLMILFRKDPKTGEEKNGLVAGPFISFYWQNCLKKQK